MLVLASTSPFRAQLLTHAGIAFTAVSPGVEEVAAAGLSPKALALDFARQKALAVAARYPDSLVLGADQTLEFQGKLLRKPKGRDDARESLQCLSGQTHALHSAICLCRQQPRALKTAVATVRLRMRSLSESEIEAYLDTGEWQGCAGGYRVESRGLALFESIRGDYHAIIGLPMLRLLRLLRAFDLNPLIEPNASNVAAAPVAPDVAPKLVPPVQR